MKFKPGLLFPLLAALFICSQVMVGAQNTAYWLFNPGPGGAYTAELIGGWNGSGAVPLSVSASGALATGGTSSATGSFTLTSASATNCTLLESGAHAVLSITNAANVAQVQTLILYDEGANPQCLSSDQLYSAVALSAGGTANSVILWPSGLRVTNGLAYKLTGSLTTGQNLRIMGN